MMREGGAAIEISNLHKSFGKTQVIRGVNLSINRGERHAIIGPNGAGKSTLFHLISGHYSPSKGSIRFNGEEIGGVEPHLIVRKGVTRSFQITNVFPRMSAFENIRCAALWPLGLGYKFWRRVESNKTVQERTGEILTRVGLESRGKVPAALLTYAEQRALDIGIALASGGEVLLLDEPTAGMNREEALNVVALVRAIATDRTVIIVEHDMNVVFELADRVSVLVYGEIIASDTPERIRANAAVQEAYLGTDVEDHA